MLSHPLALCAIGSYLKHVAKVKGYLQDLVGSSQSMLLHRRRIARSFVSADLIPCYLDRPALIAVISQIYYFLTTMVANSFPENHCTR